MFRKMSSSTNGIKITRAINALFQNARMNKPIIINVVMRRNVGCINAKKASRLVTLKRLLG
ncbi:hypothetical protein PBN151_5987 [Paenibacillus sp. NAIST15-1]|nr:hypothetical protein PBN151_5987 [Paenibacillus sp. NAIST15-1]